MAMIPCPDCKAPLSDQAASCPSCGRSFNAGWGYLPAAQVAPKKSSNVLMIVLVVILILIGSVGVLAVVAVFGVRKYIAGAKTAEAKNSLAQMGKDVVVAYEQESPSGKHRLCSSASQPVPADKSAVRGRKYMSTDSDWNRDGDTAGFGCMKFQMSMPQYFQYDYQAKADSFVLTAHGDLNGDGIVSTFELHGAVIGDRIVLEPQLIETNPEE